MLRPRFLAGSLPPLSALKEFFIQLYLLGGLLEIFEHQRSPQFTPCKFTAKDLTPPTFLEPPLTMSASPFLERPPRGSISSSRRPYTSLLRSCLKTLIHIFLSRKCGSIDVVLILPDPRFFREPGTCDVGTFFFSPWYRLRFFFFFKALSSRCWVLTWCSQPPSPFGDFHIFSISCMVFILLPEH